MSGVRVTQVGDMIQVTPPDGRNLTRADIREIFGPGLLDPQRPLGIYHEERIVYVFKCPVCGRNERNDQGMEPLCTGPSWTDDHEPTVMENRT